MKKKMPIYNYQVSFAKSLDISKDYKVKLKCHKKKETSIKLKLSLERLFNDEEYLIPVLLPFDLEHSAILPVLTRRLAHLEGIFFEIGVLIEKYSNGDLEIETQELTTFYILNLYKKNILDYVWIAKALRLKILISPKNFLDGFSSSLNSFLGTVKSGK